MRSTRSVRPSVLRRATDAGDFGAALRAYSLDRLAAILQRDLLGVLNVHHLAVFDAISLCHFLTSKQIGWPHPIDMLRIRGERVSRLRDYTPARVRSQR